MLIDEKLDRRLQRDGFVVAPLIDRATATRLRNEHLSHVSEHDDRFVSDMQVEDQAYRQWAGSTLQTTLDSPTAGLFTDHEPFLRHFLTKFPGPNSGHPLHRDWMWVDERAGERSYVVWIALEDITGHNGQLRAIRGSHRVDTMLRGTNLIAPWLDQEDVIEPRLLTIPVRAGECVVFDNALIHSSFPNNTAAPRVVAALAMRRRGAPLVHFRRYNDELADEYALDLDQLQSLTPQELLAGPPDLPKVAQVPIGGTDLEPSELARRLDAGALNRVDRYRKRARAVLSFPTTAVCGAARRLGATLHSLSDDGGRYRASPAALMRRASGMVRDLPSTAAIAVLAANEATINLLGPPTRAIWDPSEFDWAHAVERGWPQIRREVDALLEGPSEIPHIEDVTGGIPQGNVGPWRTFVLMHQGRWMEWNCRRCPETTALVRAIPGLTMAGFSVLEPGTHITEHRGPNKGALRYQLGVVVPGSPGDCRIRVGNEMLVWQEGEGVMFDFTVPHEAWNDSEGIRVLLMLEFITPLPWYLAGTNRLAQHAMSWFPTTRDMTHRLQRLEPTLQKTGSEN